MVENWQLFLLRPHFLISSLDMQTIYFAGNQHETPSCMSFQFLCERHVCYFKCSIVDELQKMIIINNKQLLCRASLWNAGCLALPPYADVNKRGYWMDEREGGQRGSRRKWKRETERWERGGEEEGEREPKMTGRGRESGEGKTALMCLHKWQPCMNIACVIKEKRREDGA